MSSAPRARAAHEAVVFGGRLLLAVIGGLALLLMVLALMVTAYVSSLSHRKVQRAAPPLPPHVRLLPPTPSP